MAQQVEAIANTLLELGRIKGQGAANQGQIWGNTLAGLGQIPQQIQQGQARQQDMQLRQQEMQIRQTQVDQAQRQQQTEALWNNAIANSLTPDNNIDFEKLAPVVKQNPGLIPHWQGLQNAMLDTQEKGAKVLEAQSKLEEAQAAHAAALANAADAAPDPETKAATLLVGLVQGGQKKSIDPQYAKQTVSRLLSASGTPDPQNVATVIAQMKQLSAADAEKRAVATKDLAEAAKAGGATGPKPITNQTELELAANDPTHPQHDVAVKALAARPETAYKPPSVGSFEDYVLRTYGKDPTPTQVLAARKAYGQADDRPRITVNTGDKVPLTPDTIEDTAAAYRILGTKALPTRFDENDKKRIMNEASKQIRALGGTMAQTLQKQAAYKSDGAALTQMTKMASSAEAFETKALAQADLIGDLSKKVDRTQYPIINRALLAGAKNITGDKNTQLLFNALDTFTTEYAKIMAGSTGSVAAGSDASAKKAEGLISAALNKGTLQATLDQMKWEMAQTRKGYGAAIEHINERLGGGPSTSSAAPANAPAAALPPVPAGMMRAFDPNGKPHLAKQGTPLPLGWTLSQ